MTATIISLEGFEEILPCNVAHMILGDYLHCYRQFKLINKHAKIRFERRDWVGIQSDAIERISQYEGFVASTTDEIGMLLVDRIQDRKTWKEIRFLFFKKL